jgi:Endonuclease/Exonuclease/phosphatase family
MKRFPMVLLLGVGAAAVFACSDRNPASPDPAFNINNPPPSARSVTVMSQNLYPGANVDLVIGAILSPDPNDDLPALLFAIETAQNTDFPARAGAIADEIARARPHAVGLQEVWQIDVDLQPLGMPVELHQDFLAILQDALASRGLHYTVAGQVQGAVAEPIPGVVSVVDHDVLLVDDRVTIASSGGQLFSLNAGQIAQGVNLVRGFVWARVAIDGTDYTIVSAHPESDLGSISFAQLRAGQMADVVALVGSDPRALVVGDLNDTPGSPVYQLLQSAGFGDTWAALHPGSLGYTCCNADDLSNSVAHFTQRIDYIWARGFGDSINGSVDRFGNVPADRVAGPAYPIWPSDHAGLLAAIR